MEKEDRHRTYAGKIVSCARCRPHSFQDKEYGDKMRFHTPGVKGGKLRWYCCTVCGNKAEDKR